jgi:hypothetical protein
MASRFLLSMPLISFLYLLINLLVLIEYAKTAIKDNTDRETAAIIIK